MRKLTVKNFSVIKEAELEFGKITVLIGPQSSGKSLLCKLAHFLGWKVTSIAIDRVVNRFEFLAFISAVREEFEKWFPSGGWGTEGWFVEFQSGDYWIKIAANSNRESSSELFFEFASAFKESYSLRLKKTVEDEQTRGFAPLIEGLRSLAATEFTSVAGRGVWDSSTYIPVDRSYFVDTAKGYRALGVDIDPVTSQFAELFANSLNGATTKRRISDYLGADLVSWPGGWMLAYGDGRFLPLSHASSGGKDLLPILSILDYYEHQRRQSGRLVSAELYGKTLYIFDDFTIEEPESSVFPKTQYDLVREIVALSNEANFQPRFTVTTHSPYLLSSFNNLLEAGQVVRDHPELRDEVAKIVPEQYWIKDGDFKAYSIHDGNLESILNESGLIEGNYLDQVSEVIGDEFDRLLRLEYDHTEA
jgi:hypothetical protein